MRDTTDAKEYDGEIGSYKITGEAPYTDEAGEFKGNFDIGSIVPLPKEIGDKFVADGVAEVAVEQTEEATVAPSDDQGVAVEPDLDALRDEKCIPVAQLIIQEMATALMPEGSDLQQIDARPVAIKGLELMLAADLNIAMEASYVPQLILGALSGLNATVQTCDALPTDDVRYAGIARKILQFVSDAKVPLTKVSPEETLAAFAPVKESINALFIEEKLSVLEVKYIMDGIFNSFTAVNNLMSGSLTDSSERAESKLFGIETMSQLTMKQLDDVLTSGSKE